MPKPESKRGELSPEKLNTNKFKSFENLPHGLAEEIKKRLIQGNEQGHRESVLGEKPEYTKNELLKIVESFIIFNNAAEDGLPNDLYKIIAKQLDPDLAGKTVRETAIWYAHEGRDEAKRHIQAFADSIKNEIDKRKDWEEGDFHKEHFLVEEN
ncbi:MAG: hypothetical protein PHT40_02440 [Patescibacteria group bacterium]|nr:hypothetical protein [Patescibacteria group bacterium]